MKFIITSVHHVNASAGNTTFIIKWLCPPNMRDMKFERYIQMQEIQVYTVHLGFLSHRIEEELNFE